VPTAEDNRNLIKTFYDAFNRHDGEAMAQLYKPDGHFRDPAFGDLDGRQAGDMWRMLTGRSEDLVVELREYDADETSGSANWIAHYTFGQTGRKVVNDVHASFRFADGRIADHVDDFSFFAWSRQALGPLGLLLGWTPLLRPMISRRARGELEKFSSR
jgi:uncharacterized protein